MFLLVVVVSYVYTVNNTHETVYTITSHCYANPLTDNPVIIPCVDAERASVQSTNGQFEYESVEKLEAMLGQQYGQVWFP